jgi:hypothetical protein
MAKNPCEIQVRTILVCTLYFIKYGIQPVPAVSGLELRIISQLLYQQCHLTLTLRSFLVILSLR